MLRFTQAQQEYILNNRRAFNARQAEIGKMMNSGSVAAIGNASTLPKDVWGEWDREGVEVQREVLSVFNSLAASVSQPMPIGKLVHHFQTISDSSAANISLDGRSKGRTDRPVIAYHGTPLPIIDVPFSYGWREVEAARTEGYQLDSAGRQNAMYKAAEKAESLVLDGDDQIMVNNTSLYGLRTHPKRNTRVTGFALNGATGEEWLGEITATLRMLHADNFKVPATIYVNWDDWFYATSTEFTAGYPKTIAQRVMELGGVREIVPADKLWANEIIAVNKDRRSLQVLNGMPLTTRAQFRANPEDDYNFVVMMAVALEIKFDAEDNCGIAHSS
jgi:uncharacterized linocin/CFP29 family protein